MSEQIGIIAEQIGGSHYKNMACQPIELIAKLKFDFIQGSILKYISRDKGNRLQDLQKAKHFCEIGIVYGGFEKKVNVKSPACQSLFKRINNYVQVNALHPDVSDVILYVAHNDYKKAAIIINNLIRDLSK